MVLVNLWHAIELKLPLLVIILAVWWFIREEPEDSASSDDDGGLRVRPAQDRSPHGPRPHPRGPRFPRRGPHGDPAPPAPARIRSATAPSRVPTQY